MVDDPTKARERSIVLNISNFMVLQHIGVGFVMELYQRLLPSPKERMFHLDPFVGIR